MRRIAISLLLCAPVMSLAQDAPSSGFLYSTKEAHSLTYACSRTDAHTLECEFVQTTVRKKTSPTELDRKLKQGRKEFASFSISPQECESYSKAVAILEGREAPPRQPPTPLSETQKQDYLKVTRLLVALCASRTEENFLNVIRAGHEKDLRTCLVSSRSFRQTFRPISSGAGISTWVAAQGGAEGPCGLVNLSRFEAETSGIGSIKLWKYTSRRAVTNPQGEPWAGASCKMLDEGEYLYDWKGDQHQLGCQYIEFSAI